MPIKISIELEQGAWARCTFRPARKSHTLFIPFDSDGMDKLIMTALVLITDFRSFSFAFNGTQTRWLLSVDPVENVEKMRFDFSECYLDYPSATVATRSIFSFDCDPIVFATTLFNALTTAIEKSGVRTYNEIWTDYPFPKALYQYLGNRVRDHANDA